MRSTLQLIGLAVVSTAVVSVYQHGSGENERLIAVPMEVSTQTPHSMTISASGAPSFKPTGLTVQSKKVASRTISVAKPPAKQLLQRDFAKL